MSKEGACPLSFYHKKIQKGTKTKTTATGSITIFYHKKIQKGTKTFSFSRGDIVSFYHKKIQKGTKTKKGL